MHDISHSAAAKTVAFTCTALPHQHSLAYSIPNTLYPLSLQKPAHPSTVIPVESAIGPASALAPLGSP